MRGSVRRVCAALAVIVGTGCGKNGSGPNGGAPAGDTGTPPRSEDVGALKDRSRGNLKQIAAAYQAYEKKHGYYPIGLVTTGGQFGRIGLSWRVQLLPHLGDPAAAALYKRFNLEEPWDGPTNRPLLAEVPSIFAPVRGSAEPGHTFYQGFADHWTEPDGSPHRTPLYYTGLDAALFPDPRSLLPTHGIPSPDGRLLSSRRAAQVLDGPAVTVLAVEAGRAVPWSKPEDVSVRGGRQQLRATGTWPALGGMFDGEANGVLLDGRVFVVKPDTPPEKLRSFVIADDGQPPDFAAIGLTPPAKK